MDFSADTNILLIGKVLLIAVLGVLVAYVCKNLLRIGMDKFILKKIFRRDLNTYETSLTITKIFTEILQWIMILLVADYALSLLDFDIISQAFSFIIGKIPQGIIFLAIVSVGILAAKMSSSFINQKDLDKKQEIGSIVEIIIITAFLLSALEYVGVKATALVELYKVILYIIGVIIVLLVIKPEIFEKSKKFKK